MLPLKKTFPVPVMDDHLVSSYVTGVFFFTAPWTPSRLDMCALQVFFLLLLLSYTAVLESISAWYHQITKSTSIFGELAEAFLGQEIKFKSVVPVKKQGSLWTPSPSWCPLSSKTCRGLVNTASQVALWATKTLCNILLWWSYFFLFKCE